MSDVKLILLNDVILFVAESNHKMTFYSLDNKVTSF